MKSAIAEEKIKIDAEPYSKVIDLGNGVMFPVNSKKEAEFVEWMIEEAKAGRASLPKRSPQPIERPAWLDTEPKMSSEEFCIFYRNYKMEESL